jgi:ABC-type Fe3+ transport system permease subunit
LQASPRSGQLCHVCGALVNVTTLVPRAFSSDTLAVVAYQLERDERLGEAALPSLAIVLVGLLPVLLSRAMRPAVTASS